MSLIREYLNKGMSTNSLETELLDLIKKYNEKMGTYLVIYASAVSKSSIPDTLLTMDDYYFIFDILRNVSGNKLDFYIETPGGSGEAVEEIVRYLRSKFDFINYVISGEAKSAGTILALSGNEISMTDSGSLGPIDAQMNIGRSTISAYDYIEWITEIRESAEKEDYLSDFDAQILAQISPGELKRVQYGLTFAKDLVVKWLTDYKFRDWHKTETNGDIVSPERKLKKAEYIADELANHGKWRTHGRSLKIEDLKEIGLRIKKIDDDCELADIVYRIQTVIKILFFSTNSYKIFATADEKLFRTVVQVQTPIINSKDDVQDAEMASFMEKCSKCGNVYQIYAKFINNPIMDDEQKNKGLIPFPKDNKLICECGYIMDLSGIRSAIESNTRRKIVD